ncbi:MAG: hypothetical protein ACKOWN_02385 [Microbacteriaceae bacterium]
MDQAVDNFIKQVQGDSVMVTGWVLVVGTAEAALAGAPLGFTMTSSQGMPVYAKLGLLESGVQSINHDGLIQAMSDAAEGPKPPF